MLDKRTNLLLEQNIYDYLSSLADQKGVSISELIRKAIREEYLDLDKKKRVLQKRQEAFEKILEMQKRMKISKKEDYKELINYGRRY